MKYLVFIVIFALIHFAYSDFLPTYFDRCSRSAPDFNTCVLNNGNRALLHVVRGDNFYNVPSMTPLMVTPQTIYRNDDDLRFIVRNSRLYGIEEIRICGVNYDLTNGRLDICLTIPSLVVMTNYQINGTVLNRNIVGVGTSNQTFVNLVLNTTVMFQTDSDNFSYFFNPVTSFVADRVFYVFTNLFNGNATATADMNQFLNDNWTVYQDLFRGASIGWSRVVQYIFQAYLDLVPLDRVFLS